jgi:polar amino acid transport system permease protein
VGYRWDFSAILQVNVWLNAMKITLLYSIGTVAGGMMIGVICGVALLSHRRWMTTPIYAYVELFRCTPLLVQIVWFYYALPIILDYSLPAWLASALGLTLYQGAFCSEIFRGGVVSIDKGQWQAARALGMTYPQLMAHIILPQATRRMVPPFVNQAVLQLKNTSLLYVVAVPDLMYTSSLIVGATYRPLEVYTFVALLYFALLYPATVFAKRLEQRSDK